MCHKLRTSELGQATQKSTDVLFSVTFPKVAKRMHDVFRNVQTQKGLASWRLSKEIWIDVAPEPPCHGKLHAQTVSQIKTSFLPEIVFVRHFVKAMRKTTNTGTLP